MPPPRLPTARQERRPPASPPWPPRSGRGPRPTSPPGWGPDRAEAGSRTDFEAQVAERAVPQRAARYDAECGIPDVGLVQRDPDGHAGQCSALVGQVVRFDQATGPCSFRAAWGTTPYEYSFEYEGENAAVAIDEPCPSLDTVGVDDTVGFRAVVAGGLEHDTQVGGTAYAVSFWAYDAALVTDR